MPDSVVSPKPIPTVSTLTPGSNPSASTFKPLFLIFAFFVGVVIGVAGGYLLTQQQKNSNSNQPVSADSSQVLKNAVLSGWIGTVEGKIAAKDNESVTLERNGSTLKIYFDSQTKFVTQGSEATRPAELKLGDLAIGTNVRGGVTISKTDQHIIANGFTVVE